MNERIKELRKRLDLTQQEFADKIGMKRNTIANYEINRNEPSNAVITLICKVFNINENWLRTGEGEMFQEREAVSLDAYADEHDMTDVDREILFAYMHLKESSRRDLITCFGKLLAPSHEGSPENDIDKEVEDYRKELEEEKSTQTSSVLLNTDAKIV